MTNAERQILKNQIFIMHALRRMNEISGSKYTEFNYNSLGARIAETNSLGVFFMPLPDEDDSDSRPA